MHKSVWISYSCFYFHSRPNDKFRLIIEFISKLHRVRFIIWNDIETISISILWLTQRINYIVIIQKPAIAFYTFESRLKYDWEWINKRARGNNINATAIKNNSSGICVYPRNCFPCNNKRRYFPFFAGINKIIIENYLVDILYTYSRALICTMSVSWNLFSTFCFVAKICFSFCDRTRCCYLQNVVCHCYGVCVACTFFTNSTSADISPTHARKMKWEL